MNDQPLLHVDATQAAAGLRREGHRGMSGDLVPQCDHVTGCITCGDEAVEMRVLRIDRARELALCSAEADGRRSTVEIALVQPVAEGDRLLVHAGTAIAHAGSEVAA
jgi:hydrogenase maturation factor